MWSWNVPLLQGGRDGGPWEGVVDDGAPLALHTSAWGCTTEQVSHGLLIYLILLHLRSRQSACLLLSSHLDSVDHGSPVGRAHVDDEQGLGPERVPEHGMPERVRNTSRGQSVKGRSVNTRMDEAVLVTGSDYVCEPFLTVPYLVAVL